VLTSCPARGPLSVLFLYVPPSLIPELDSSSPIFPYVTSLLVSRTAVSREFRASPRGQPRIAFDLFLSEEIQSLLPPLSGFVSREGYIFFFLKVVSVLIGPCYMFRRISPFPPHILNPVKTFLFFFHLLRLPPLRPSSRLFWEQIEPSSLTAAPFIVPFSFRSLAHPKATTQISPPFPCVMAGISKRKLESQLSAALSNSLVKPHLPILCSVLALSVLPTEGDPGLSPPPTDASSCPLYPCPASFRRRRYRISPPNKFPKIRTLSPDFKLRARLSPLVSTGYQSLGRAKIFSPSRHGPLALKDL